jgi:hypothetical protein
VIQTCYILSANDGDGTGMDVYSVRSAPDEPNVLIFQEREDAERYVIMLREDDSYDEDKTNEMDVLEVPLEVVVQVLEVKGHSYIFIKPDDLFIPQ